MSRVPKGGFYTARGGERNATAVRVGRTIGSANRQGSEGQAAMTDVQTRTLEIEVGADGTLVIPEEYRRALGLDGPGRVRVTLTNGELRIRPADAAEPRGSAWLRELYDYFAPARQEAIEKGYTEEEINRWIDEAVAEVRAAKRG